MFKKLSTSQRKMLNWLGFVIVVGIGFMLIQPARQNKIDTSLPLTQTTQLYDRQINGAYDYEERTQCCLTEILTQIKGVGEVKVFVTLDRGSSVVLAQSVTEETKNSGESRISKNPVILRSDGNKEAPLIIEEYQPVIRGVLVVAAGAENPDIRYQIFKAVQAALHLPMYRIEVLPKGN